MKYLYRLIDFIGMAIEYSMRFIRLLAYLVSVTFGILAIYCLTYAILNWYFPSFVGFFINAFVSYIYLPEKGKEAIK